MIIRNITLNNYRLYEGKNTISFPQDDDKTIFLISGENGFGKTTFLHSLIWCLYGRLISEVEAEVRKDIANSGYNTFLKSNLNSKTRVKFESLDEKVKDKIKKRGYSLNTEYVKSFSTYCVSINFEDVIIPSLPCTSLEVIRSYDMLLEKEEVKILIDGKLNELTTTIGAEVFINDFILSKDIARFFFFDSEQIVALAETTTATERRRLCSAYNEVLGVSKYEDLKKNLENVRLRLRRKSSDSIARDNLIKIMDHQALLEQQILDKRVEQKKQEEELLQLRKEDEALQLQLMREGNDTTTAEIKRLEKVIEASKIQYEEDKRKLHKFLEYAPFAITGRLLKETREQIEHDYKLRAANNEQLSRNLVVSQITSDLMLMFEHSHLDNNSKSELIDRVQELLEKYKGETCTEEAILVLSESDYEEFSAVYNNIITTYRTEFEHLTDDYRKNKQILERNSRKLSNIQSKEKDELIKDLRSKKNSMEAVIEFADQGIRLIHEDIGTLTQELATTRKRVAELSKIVSLDDSDAKKDALAEQLISELSSFLIALKLEKKYSLERRIKATLNTLMHKEDFIGRVEVIIDGEDMDIDLFSVEGRLISKDSLSKGEQQLYATSILKALVDESGIQFPVFIDSPLQKFDKSHATKIITEFYPHISKQVVLFPLLHKELTAEEYEVMKPLVKATYLIKNDITHSHIESVDLESFMKE